MRNYLCLAFHSISFYDYSTPQAFRTSHISLVADYIIAQQKKGVNKVNKDTYKQS
jgi:hypothetical protein